MRTDMRGKRWMYIQPGHTVLQEVWLSDTADPCIIGLYLLI